MTPDSHLESFRKTTLTRIVAMDGGGIYGLSSAILLRRLCERNEAFLDGDVTIFAGTSAGALNALLLASYDCPREAVLNGVLESFWKNPKLFAEHRSPLKARLSRAGLSSWFGPEGFVDVLQDHFGEKTLGDLPHRVLISAFNWAGNAGRRTDDPLWDTQNFSNFPDRDAAGGGDRALPVKQVAYDAIALPGFLPVHNGLGDGGIFAASPALNALSKSLQTNIAHSSRYLPVKAVAVLEVVSRMVALQRSYFGTLWQDFREHLFSAGGDAVPDGERLSQSWRPEPGAWVGQSLALFANLKKAFESLDPQVLAAAAARGRVVLRRSSYPEDVSRAAEMYDLNASAQSLRRALEEGERLCRDTRRSLLQGFGPDLGDERQRVERFEQVLIQINRLLGLELELVIAAVETFDGTREAVDELFPANSVIAACQQHLESWHRQRPEAAAGQGDPRALSGPEDFKQLLRHKWRADSLPALIDTLRWLQNMGRGILENLIPSAAELLGRHTMLSIGVGNKVPYYWLRDFDLGPLGYALLPTNPPNRNYYPPSTFLQLDAPTDNVDEQCRQLLQDCFYRLNPHVLGPPQTLPTFGALMLVKHPWWRRWITDSVYRAMASKQAEDELAGALAFLESPRWREGISVTGALL